MKTVDFDYYLPAELIAQTPVEPRDSSRLLLLHRASEHFEHRRFRELVSLLRPGDVLVANDSRVLAGRLFGRKADTGGRVELLLLARHEDGGADRGAVWEVLARPARRLRPGTEIEIEGADPPSAGEPPAGPRRLLASVLGETNRGSRLVRFGGVSDVGAALAARGAVPLPPYIRTPLVDPDRYQTVYARNLGSAAAPTAGLHFTPELIAQLEGRDVRLAFVTLHVGLDTFRPVQAANIADHEMHSEFAELSEETAGVLNAARREGGRIVAVGTTAVRVLESAAAESGAIAPYRDRTRLFIYPGYRFKAIDALLTNFHLPRSTLLMLVSALAGRERVLAAYAEAARQGYRFYSFGDAMLIL